ncbi:MAG: AAA family ATPase [Candidatus Binatia bacterium]
MTRNSAPPPHNLKAEQGVLGAILVGHRPFSEIGESIGREHFRDERHRKIFSAMRDLSGRNGRIEQHPLTDHLRRTGDLEAAGGADYIGVLVFCCKDPGRIDEYIRTVQGAGAQGEAPKELPLTPLRDLLSEPKEEYAWLVEDRLPVGGLSVLAGKPKAGKSTLARCLALAVARGEPWLGFQTTQGTVFYLALEEKRSEVRKHFEAMGAAPKYEDQIFLFIASSPKDGLIQLREATESKKPALIIVDPLFRFVRVRDANDYAQVMEATEPLQVLAHQTGAHVFTVHHLGKGERSGGDAILGSTAIFAAVDTAMLMKRTERYRTLYSIQRYGIDLEEMTLTLDPETRLVSGGPSRREADERQAAEAIVECLRTKGEPVEEKIIHDSVEGRKAVKQSALRTLVAEGRVKRTGEGKRGSPYLYEVSGFLTPTHIREPENHISKSDGNPCKTTKNSSTRVLAESLPKCDSGESETEERERFDL